MATSGDTSVSPLETTIYTLTAKKGGRSTSTTVQVVVEEPGVPIIEYFTTDGYYLRWSVSGAEYVIIDGSGIVSSSGSRIVSPGSTTTYTLTAWNDGVSREASVQIVVEEADVLEIEYFEVEGSFLSWSVFGASSVQIDNGIGNVALIGTTSVSPDETTTYTLTATKEDRSTDAMVQVIVEESSGASISGLVHLSSEPWDSINVELKDVDRNILQSTTTINGLYHFSSLTPGTYYVWAEIPDSDIALGTPVEITENIFTYTVDIDLPKLFDLSLPADGSTLMDLKPSLYWEPVEHAVEYRGQVNVESNGELVVMFNTEIPTYTFFRDLTPGVEYAWLVNAFDEDGNQVGLERKDFLFTVSSDATEDIQPSEDTLQSGWSITTPILDGDINIEEWYDAYQKKYYSNSFFRPSNIYRSKQ